MTTAIVRLVLCALVASAAVATAVVAALPSPPSVSYTSQVGPCQAVTNTTGPAKHVQTLTPPPPSAAGETGYQYFGSGIACDGPHCVVCGGDANNSAVAFFYRWNATTRQFEMVYQTRAMPSPSGGCAVTLRGNLAIFEAESYLYNDDKGAWGRAGQVATLPASGTPATTELGENTLFYPLQTGAVGVVEAFALVNGRWHVLPNTTFGSDAAGARITANGEAVYDEASGLLYVPVHVYRNYNSTNWVRVYATPAAGELDDAAESARRALDDPDAMMLQPPLKFHSDIVTPVSAPSVLISVGRRVAAYKSTVIVPYLGMYSTPGGVFAYEYVGPVGGARGDDGRDHDGPRTGDYRLLWNFTSLNGNTDGFGFRSALDYPSGVAAVSASIGNRSHSPSVYLFTGVADGADADEPISTAQKQQDSERGEGGAPIGCWTVGVPYSVKAWTSSNFGALIEFTRPDPAVGSMLLATESFSGDRSPGCTAPSGMVHVYAVGSPGAE